MILTPFYFIQITLTRCRAELNDMKNKETELRIELEAEKRKAENAKMDYKTHIILAEKLQEERETNMAAFVKNKIEYDLVHTERDCLRRQNQTLQSEIDVLKKRIESLEGQNVCHVLYQQEITKELHGTKALLEQLVKYAKKYDPGGK